MHWTEDAKKLGTTYERLCYHLHHAHGRPDWSLTHRGQTELEAMHERCHQITCNHVHARPVVIVGYEPDSK